MSLLEIKDLHTYFDTKRGLIKAVNGVSLTIEEGRTLGVVGESGSGKSQTAMSILKLFEQNQKIYSGEIYFDGKKISDLNAQQMSHIRGNDISIIFQEPMTSLNPIFTVNRQISEVLMLHQKLSKKEAEKRSIEMLQQVKIANPVQVNKSYPFQLSGGMRQRVMIAMALACRPKLLIADEPTTALDVTIQEQILNLIAELNERMGMSVLFITHDLGAMAQLCHSVRVMYLGNLVEEARTEELFARPMHPYTQGLLDCIPRLDSDRSQQLHVISGVVPPLSNVPDGCRFCTRCPYADQRCMSQNPPSVEVFPEHKAKCWKYTPEQEAE